MLKVPSGKTKTEIFFLSKAFSADTGSAVGRVAPIDGYGGISINEPKNRK
jgi:hypothetical protein